MDRSKKQNILIPATIHPLLTEAADSSVDHVSAVFLSKPDFSMIYLQNCAHKQVTSIRTMVYCD